jgi:MscS family membrane protein
MLYAASLALALTLAGQTAAPCPNAKVAAGTWLSNLQPRTYRPARAAACAEVPAGWSQGEVEGALIQLKRAIDAAAIPVDVAGMPDDPAFIDPSTGVSRVPIAPGFDDRLLIAKRGSRWLITSETLQLADELVHSATIDLSRLRDSMPSWMQTPLPIIGMAGWQVVFLIGFLLLGLIVRLLVSNLLSSQLEGLMRRLKVQWGEQLMHRASTPLGNVALAGVLALAQPSLELSLTPAQVLAVAIRVLAAFSAIHLVYRSTDLLAAYLKSKAAKTETKLDDQLVPIVTRALKTATVAIGVIFVLQNLDVDVTGLITGVGLGGLAFALAAQDAVKNLFGSVTIFLDKPFQIGDWVVASGVEGTVEEVGIRSTRIRTFYNSVVTVPNAKFTEAVVDNYGRRNVRRTSTTLGLTYDTPPEKMEAFCDGVRAILKAHPLVWKNFYEVQFSGFGDFSLNVMLYFFFKCDTWSQELRARHEIYLDILRLAGELKVSFAFPTQTLHVDSMAEPMSMTPPAHPSIDQLKKTIDSFGPGGAHVIPPGQRVHDDGFYAG